MKIKLTISYDGSQFFGSAIQPDQVTVHSKLLDAFKILKIDPKLNMSGRTDRDVHAFRQIISCDVPEHWRGEFKNFKKVLNKLLPNSILIRNITEESSDFHARFSAKKREYRYLFTDKKLTPFNANYISYYETIDEDIIKEAIKILEGEHDFEYFSKKGSEPATTIREIYKIRFYKHKDIYVLNFQANSYLRSQIRMMVDFVLKISRGKLTLDDLQKQLRKDKLISWTLASPHGLYLSNITY
ncbi:MAG: tRNA pseudouridine(38-40) synthase TruA [Campylobacterota bacterium]|nr:tRNA pseudouridine(38-40) synthase TruA [Campylobacterota bacterium]